MENAFEIMTNKRIWIILSMHSYEGKTAYFAIRKCILVRKIMKLKKYLRKYCISRWPVLHRFLLLLTPKSQKVFLLFILYVWLHNGKSV